MKNISKNNKSKMFSLVIIILGILWVSFNNLDLLNENQDPLSTDGVETTEAYASQTETPATTTADTNTYSYTFRYQDLYDQHFEKHGHEFGDITKEEYLAIANALFTSDEALRKTESDGDLLFYDVASNTFGVLSEDGYIRTCFKPDDGIEYWNRQ